MGLQVHPDLGFTIKSVLIIILWHKPLPLTTKSISLYVAIRLNSRKWNVRGSNKHLFQNWPGKSFMKASQISFPSDWLKWKSPRPPWKLPYICVPEKLCGVVHPTNLFTGIILLVKEELDYPNLFCYNSYSELVHIKLLNRKVT